MSSSLARRQRKMIAEAPKINQLLQVGGQLENVSAQIEAVNRQLGTIGDIEKSVNAVHSIMTEVIAELARQRYTNLRLFKTFVDDSVEVELMEERFRAEFDLQPPTET